MLQLICFAFPLIHALLIFLQVKALYVKSLPKTVTQDQLKKVFEHHGEITKVVLPPAKSGHENRFGFVHFAERSMAMKALQNTERYEIDSGFYSKKFCNILPYALFVV